MANSRTLETIKNKVIYEIIQDSDIVRAINKEKIETSDELINSQIFDFAQNPSAVKDIQTFMTIKVDILTYTDYTQNYTYTNPSLIIDIITHVDCMKVKDIPNLTSNRNDYLAMLLDEKFNGKYGFGNGKMTLIGNIEGSLQKDWVYRRMTFQTTDLNHSNCEEENEGYY